MRPTRFSTALSWILSITEDKTIEMNRTVILPCIVVLLISLLLAVQFRFELVAAQSGGAHAGTGMVYRLDRWTGKIVAINGFESDVINLNEWQDAPFKSSPAR